MGEARQKTVLYGVPEDPTLMKRLCLLVFVLILSACRPVAATSTSIPATETPAPSNTPEPTAIPPRRRSPLPQPRLPNHLWFVAPLEDETFDSLSLILTKGIELPPISVRTSAIRDWISPTSSAMTGHPSRALKSMRFFRDGGADSGG